MRNILLLIFFIGLQVNSFGQQALADSLERAIRTGVARDTSRVNALNRLAVFYWYKDSERAFQLSREAVTLAEKLKFKRGLAAAWNILGVSYDIKSQFDSAIHYYNLAAELSREIGYVKVEGSALNNIGMVYKNRGEFSKSLEIYLDALRLFEKQKDELHIGRAYNNIGLVYFDLKQYHKALDYHEKSLKIREKVGDKYGVGASLTNLGLAWSNLGDDDKALKFYEQSLKIKEEINDKYGLGILLNNMAIIYQAKKKNEKALEMYNKSEQYHRDIDDDYGLVYTYVNMSVVLSNLKNFERSKAVLDSAMRISINLKSRARIAKVLEGYSFYYPKTGNYVKAYQALRSLDSIKDSLYTENMSRSIAEMNTKYETEKKESEIALLNQQNEIKTLEIHASKIRQRNSLLVAGIVVLLTISGMTLWYVRTKYRNRVKLESEKAQMQKSAFAAVVTAEENERKRIAMELHDGLGQLLSAARLNVSVLEDTTNNEDREVVENAEALIDQAIADLRNISHNLMPSALIRLGLVSALNDMAEKINSSRQIAVKVEATGISARLPENFEIAIYRVVQEAVNNILKHANARNISVSLGLIGENLSLTIADDGKGMPEDAGKKSGRGIGWDDIRSRVSLFNGNMKLYSEPGKGTQLSINFSKLAL